MTFMPHGQLFDLPAAGPGGEYFEILASTPWARVERIVSRGDRSPEGFWYDQPTDEWVILLQGRARLSFADGRELTLLAGEWLLIPARQRHRVEETSSDPPCVWVAVHLGAP